jgi:hypothetical protein
MVLAQSDVARDQPLWSVVRNGADDLAVAALIDALVSTHVVTARGYHFSDIILIF